MSAKHTLIGVVMSLLLLLTKPAVAAAQTKTCDDVLLLVDFTLLEEDKGHLTLYWYDLRDKSAVPVVSIPTSLYDGFRDTTVVVGAWSPDRTRILYTVSGVFLGNGDDAIQETHLYQLDCLGSRPTPLASGDTPFSVYGPIWSADASSVTYIAHLTSSDRQQDSFRIEVVNADGSGRRVLYDTTSYLDWIHRSSGGLIFIEGPTLYLLTNGEKTPLFVLGYLSLKSPSPDGTKVALTHTTTVGETVDLLLFDLQRLRMSVLAADVRFGVTSVSWSPDGSQLAFIERGQDAFRVKIINVDRGGLTSLGEPITGWGYFSVLTEWIPGGESLLLRTDTRSDHEYFLLHLSGELEAIVLSPSES